MDHAHYTSRLQESLSVVGSLNISKIRGRCVMAIRTNMSNYEIEADSIAAEYSDEIMCAGWNPDVGLVCQHLPLEPSNPHMAMPVDIATEISELFLRKIYSCQE